MLITLSIGDRASQVIQEYYRLESAQIYEEDDPVQHSCLFHKDLAPRLLQVTSTATKKSEFEKQVKLFMNQEEIKNTFHQCNPVSLEPCLDATRKLQEGMDRCYGFQTLVDCDNSFGSLGLRIIETIQEENPKTPFLSFNLLEEKGEQDVLNKAISMISIPATMIVPFNIPPSESFSFFRSHEDVHQQSAQLISNLTLPYRLKDCNTNLEDFAQRMVPYRDCNIFNCHAIMPVSEEENVLTHKQKLSKDVAILQGNYMERVVKYDQKYRSFGESYMIRGVTKIPEDRELNSVGIDIKIIDEIYSLPKEWSQRMFEDDIIEVYGEKVQRMNVEEEKKEEEEEKRVRFYGMQSCLFSNECQKYNLQNQLNQLEMVRSKTLNQFLKEEFTRDDLEQLKNEFQLKISSYGDYDSGSESD